MAAVEMASTKPKSSKTEEGSAVSTRASYIAELERQAAIYPQMPDVEIRYSNLSYQLKVTKKEANRELETVGGAIMKLATTPVRIVNSIRHMISGTMDSSDTTVKVLENCSGVIKPGSLTLLISPPGHGKTSFLRALAGRLPQAKVSGSLTYSGCTPDQLRSQGMEIRQIVQYVDQLDVHLPYLTVRETFDFACSNGTVDPAFMENPELVATASRRVENIINLLGLQNCANTVVGNDLLRGVSGGEKKRVTIGEAMVSNARCFLMDEISTGLDASTTFDIVSSIRSWTRATRGTVVIALLQPTPEVYSLFDDVILLREGTVVYHGPRPSIADYLSSIGFDQPSASGGADAAPTATATATATAPDAPGAGVALDGTGIMRQASRQVSDGTNQVGKKQDIADWLVEVLTHPRHEFVRSQNARMQAALASGVPNAVLGNNRLPGPLRLMNATSINGVTDRPQLAGVGSDRNVGTAGNSVEGGSTASPKDVAHSIVPASPNPGSDNISSTNSGGLSAAQSPMPLLSHKSALGMDGASSATSSGPLSVNPNDPITTTALHTKWEASQLFQSMMASPHAPAMKLESAFAKRQYGLGNPRPAWHHFLSLLDRQWKLTYRNRLFIVFRVMSGIVMALVLGSVFFRLGSTEGIEKYGLFLFAMLHVAFSNFAELPQAVEYKYIAYKHVAAGMYPPSAFVSAITILHIPIAALECAFFGVVLYFMCGLAMSAGRFFFFIFMLFFVDIGMASLFRVFAFASPDLETAQVSPGPVVSIQMLFAGFLITRSKMSWLLFLHYISLFGYGLRSLAQNEFFDEEYDATLGPGGPRLGDYYLTFFDFQTESGWKWGGIAFGCGFFLFMAALSAVVIKYVRIERNVGSSRKSGGELEDVEVAVSTGYNIVTAAEGLGLQTEEFGGSVPGGSNADLASLAERGRGAASPLSPSGQFGSALMSPMSPSPSQSGHMGSAMFLNVASAPSSAAAPASASASTTDLSALGTTVNPLPVPTAAATSPSSTTMVPVSISSPNAVKSPGRMVASGAASVLPFEPMTVVFTDIEYTVNLPRDHGGGTKKLLQGCTGYALPGTLTALMGASGAGKTTLLDVIGGRKNSGFMKGDVMLNGFPKEAKSFMRLTAYVEQQDIHHPLATVREALEFSAALRLPATVTTEQRAAFVAEVLTILELTDIADRKIGEPGAADGLAPGQRKRVTIGVELVSNAPIIFLDEPTTGLDSRAAAVVMRVIQNIAKTGRTVISTIHQPSADIFLKFDQLLLLQRGGWQVYFGPVGRHGKYLVRYLESIPGVPRCPRRMNPASWMLDVLAGTDSSIEAEDGPEHQTSARQRQNSHAGAADAAAVQPSSNANAANGVATAPKAAADVESHAGHPFAQYIQPGRRGPDSTSPGVYDFHSIYFNSSSWAAAQSILRVESQPKPGATPVRFDSLYARSVFFQLATLFKRNWIGYYRNVDYNYVRIFTLLWLQLLFGVIYYKVDGSDPGGIQSLASVMFMSSAFVAMTNMNTLLPVLVKERAVFYRERFSYLYDSIPFSLANFLIELPWLVVICITSVPIIYFMTGFAPEAGAFFFYCFVVWLLCLVFTSVAMVSAAVFGSILTAQAAMGMVIPLTMLFGGLFLREPAIPIYWKWAHYLDPVKYLLEALIAPQFYCDSSAGSCPTIDINMGQGFVTINRSDYVQDSFGMFYSNRWRNVGILALFIFGLQMAHFLSVRYISHLKR